MSAQECFQSPYKLLHTIRSVPCFKFHLLDHFNYLQCSLLESICNIQLSDSAWFQTSLPPTSGGFGVRSAVILAPSAYLASWSVMIPSNASPPTGTSTIHQKNVDSPVIEGHSTPSYLKQNPEEKHVCWNSPLSSSPNLN